MVAVCSGRHRPTADARRVCLITVITVVMYFGNGSDGSVGGGRLAVFACHQSAT